MNFERSSILGQCVILFLILLFAAFTAGLIEGNVAQIVSPWLSPPVHVGNMSTSPLPEMILQPDDLSGNYTIMESRVRDISEISAIGRDLGWKRGFIVRYQQSGSTAYCGPSIQQTISVYPVENVTRALPYPRYHRRMAQESNMNVVVEELPVPGIGDVSTATKMIDNENTCNACLVDFVKNDVYSQIQVYGPAPDCETAKKLAEIAAAKIK